MPCLSAPSFQGHRTALCALQVPGPSRQRLLVVGLSQGLVSGVSSVSPSLAGTEDTGSPPNCPPNWRKRQGGGSWEASWHPAPSLF